MHLVLICILFLLLLLKENLEKIDEVQLKREEVQNILDHMNESSKIKERFVEKYTNQHILRDKVIMSQNEDNCKIKVKLDILTKQNEVGKLDQSSLTRPTHQIAERNCNK